MELVTMDGHTRLMYLLVDYAKKREQELKIHLVDIDENKKVTVNISSEESSQELAGANF